MDDIKITGAEELDAALQELPATMQRTILGKATLDGAEVLAEEARARAPVDTGRLRDSINAKRGRTDKDYVQSGVAIAKIKSRQYWHFAEFGTVKEPARPFLRPAMEAAGQRSVDALAASVRANIDRVVARLRRR